MAPLRPIPTLMFENRITDIIISAKCGRHNNDPEEACWTFPSASGKLLRGVCNRRARKAGFSHKISDKSLQINRSKKK